jgi:hypothetical protein
MSGAVYNPAEVERHATRARHEGIKLGRTANGFIFRATSGQSGIFEYTVTVTPGENLSSAACTCRAGQEGRQCKHGAAAIAAVELRTLSDAARILARRSAQVRKARKVA